MVILVLPPFSGSRSPLVGHWFTLMCVCFFFLIYYHFYFSVFIGSGTSRCSNVSVGSWVSMGVVATRVGGYFSLCGIRCGLITLFMALCLSVLLFMLFYSNNIWQQKPFT